jgi:zinc finger protein
MTEKKAEQQNQDMPEALVGQTCPMCRENTLTLMEHELEVPYFGKIAVFSMDCDTCKYHKADVEALEQKEPCKYTLEINSEQDMKIRIVKSSNAIVKIPYIGTIEPGIASNGYITNVEGILNRIKRIVEHQRDSEEDEEIKTKAKNMLKKIQKITWGHEPAKLIIEDPSGNSAIISEKAVYEKMKAKKEKGKEE